MASSWQVLSTTFMKDDKSYGGGQFRIRGRDVVTLKVAAPKLTFKPGSAEFSEPWMNDSGEELNRTAVTFLRGTIDGSMHQTFQHLGQNAAWWYSPDWRTIYVSTAWMDMKSPIPKDGNTPQITTLWRSTDGGTSWQQLEWPQDNDIGQLLFIDASHGYAVGWGPHVWRTADGGNSWQEIEVPPQSHTRNSRRCFEGVDLSPDGILRVAYYVTHLMDVSQSTEVYRLGWQDKTFSRETTLPNQVVVQLRSSPMVNRRYSMIALSSFGPPEEVDDPLNSPGRVGAISEWTSDHPTAKQLRTFDKSVEVDGLDVGRNGVMQVYGTRIRSAEDAPQDQVFATMDGGKSWTTEDSDPLQGGYFDTQTNTEYVLFGYTLKKRQL